MLLRLALLTFALILAAAPLAAAEFSVDTYTLEDCTRLALRNNAELQSAEQGITIAKQRVLEATFLFLPEFGLQASATRYSARYPFALRPNYRSILLFPSDSDNVYSGQAYMSLPLYEGRRGISTLQMSRAALKQAQSKYDAVKLDILYSVKRVFFQLLLSQELSSAADEAGLKTAELLKGLSRPWERLEAESLAAELRAAQSETKHGAQLARLDFLRSLSKELDAPVKVLGKLDASPAEMDIKKALIWATELRPELKSERAKAQMDDIAVNLALSRRYPTVVLGADYELTGQTFPLRQNNWDATIGIKLPFAFDFWTQHTQKVAEQRQGELARAELQDQVEIEVRRAYEDMSYWRSEWPRREEDFNCLKAIAAEAGQSGAFAAPMESLRAQTRIFAARRAYLKALTEHILARARFERAVGRHLATE
ncbi:MAG: TolC family protein [Elusimicrobia bacterium]|nr:TolC family protein [Elusimicrobiota bacterium]